MPTEEKRPQGMHQFIKKARHWRLEKIKEGYRLADLEYDYNDEDIDPIIGWIGTFDTERSWELKELNTPETIEKFYDEMQKVRFYGVHLTNRNED